MKTMTLALACIVVLGLSCSKKRPGQDADTDPVDDALEVEDGTDADDDAPTGVTPIVPEMGTIHTVGIDCRDAYTLPAEFTSDEGLGHHGWTLDDLQFTLAWSVDNRFDNHWISRNDASTPSLRTHPHLVPEAGYCYKREVAAGLAGDATLVPLLEGISAFSHPESTYSGLEKDVYTPPDYDLTGEDVLVAAIRGLFELPNEFPDAPDVTWDETVETNVLMETGFFPQEVKSALAKLVLSIGEAYLLKQAAFADADDGAMQRIHQQFLDDYYATLDTTMAHPLGGTILMDMLQNGTWVHYEFFHAAAMSVAGAAEELLAVLSTISPMEEGYLSILTPHGRIIVDLEGGDTTYSAADLAEAVIIVDLAGNDSYGGRYASTHQYWMSASVLVDASGDDVYTPETYDIEDAATTKFEAFMNEHGFTQGAGLCGVGVLIDGAGSDLYTASMYAQGSGTFGVGILHDVDGSDQYRLGTTGQGTGFFGIGLHLESGGDDRYGVYTIGQGAGKPYGHGALIDRQGTDTYIAYYNEMEPWLPGPGYNNYFSLTSAWPYSDSEGNPHYMSNAQGVGWGFRHEWVEPEDAWMGGFGALLDLGTGNDEHYADCMSMGQGFVYGFGFLYDEGGDDRYRTFWWGPAAAAHMGVGLFVDEDGNDDLHVAHASGGFGYDCSVGWLLDNGGNDTYGGQFHYGKGYTWGLTFMINSGGDDVYNDGSVLTDPPFGIVQKAYAGVNLIGMFMDLGGGTDTYNTTYAGVGNDALWYHEPIGDNADPAFHKGVGIDK